MLLVVLFSTVVKDQDDLLQSLKRKLLAANKRLIAGMKMDFEGMNPWEEDDHKMKEADIIPEK